MRIIVITKNIGLTPTGRVFETLVSHLIKYCEVTIICTQYAPTDIEKLKDAKIVVLPKQNIRSTRFRKYLNRWGYKYFNNSYDNYWFLKECKKISVDKYDCILALCGAMCLYPLAIGDWLKSHSNKPFIAYLVDACPLPEWWGKTTESNGIKKYLKSYTHNVDLFLSANNMMLEYQKKYISSNIKHLSYIYPIVCSSTEIVSKKRENNHITFLFTGSLYGLRTPNILFKAFEKLIEDYPDATLCFVGTKRTVISLAPKSITNNIKVIDFTTNLTPYYEDATALIDIDANVNYDVFLSSKLTAYLNIPRPIISQTGLHTPARHLLKDVKSVLLCDHNEDSVYNAMIKSIREVFDYQDRKKILDLFNYDTVCKNIINWTTTR